MDNKKAITNLQAVRANTANAFIAKVAIREALDTAIAALEFKERYDNFWEEVKSEGMKGKETEIHHGGRVFRIREVAQ